MQTNEMVPYYLNKFTDMLEHTSIHSVEQGECFKPHSKAVGRTSSLQHVLFLVLVNNFLQALSQASEDGLTIPVMSVCLA